MSAEDAQFVRELVTRHVKLTGSELGSRVLADFDALQSVFVKVMPRDFKRVLQAIAEAEKAGEDVDTAIMAAANG